MEFLREYQLIIMTGLTGVCAVLALLAMLTHSLSRTRRVILVFLELGAMVLMIADINAYKFRGDPSDMGFWMVRICNFMVYFMTLFLIYNFNNFVIDLLRNEQQMQTIPKRLRISELIFVIGVILLIISQFTGLYYTFDDLNQYQRAPGFFISFIIPLLMTGLQLTVIFQHHDRMGRTLYFSMVLFSLTPIATSILQIFTYGVSLLNMAIVAVVIVLFIIALVDLDRMAEHANQLELEMAKDEQVKVQRLFEQTAEALANAIDAKDQYTHGHSTRVARYSQRIARVIGKSEEECNDIYFVALLHDVGKIGVPDYIINKEGKLTTEEFAEIKKHPVIGEQILSTISSSPYLSIGAHFHHERYDGRGYPDGLIGDDIPEIARIIAVADAYDAMTSKRSYRDPIPQQKVREELLKGMGTQFDAEFARIMLHMIDEDTGYEMKEGDYDPSIYGFNGLECRTIGNDCSTGIHVDAHVTKIRMKSRKHADGSVSLPAMILFDALDGRVHDTEFKKKDLLYTEYAILRFDGRIVPEEIRNEKTIIRDLGAPGLAGEEPDGGRSEAAGDLSAEEGTFYEIEAVRLEDHARIRIRGGGRAVESILALPDSIRFCYISLTGENCIIDDIRVDRSESVIGEGEIPRIAEKISYVDGCPEGDVPNVEIDGWCEGATEGIPIDGRMKLTFHSRSLPTARLVWHCPYISLFTSEDGSFRGEGFREFVLIRLDGENREPDEHAENRIAVDRGAEFESWDIWKKTNKEGMDISVDIIRNGNEVVITTKNLGISIHSVTTISDEVERLYVAVTGDQVAITDVRAAR